MLTTRIFPLNINIYAKGKISSGEISSEEELQETVSFLKEKEIFYTLSYRTENLQIEHETNNRRSKNTSFSLTIKGDGISGIQSAISCTGKVPISNQETVQSVS